MHGATSDVILRVKNYTLLSLQNQIVEKTLKILPYVIIFKVCHTV
jgi:hypothetical protein